MHTDAHIQQHPEAPTHTAEGARRPQESSGTQAQSWADPQTSQTHRPPITSNAQADFVQSAVENLPGGLLGGLARPKSLSSASHFYVGPSNPPKCSLMLLHASSSTETCPQTQGKVSPPPPRGTLSALWERSTGGLNARAQGLWSVDPCVPSGPGWGLSERCRDRRA